MISIINPSDVHVVSSGEYVGVRITPSAAQASRPYHIALLIDTSGSMNADGRLTTVQQTLQLLVDQMHDTDALTLVSYNHEASILCRAESNKDVIRSHIDALRASGGTNFETAFMVARGIPVDAVFVLTDGEVNQGITSVAGLKSLASSCFPRTAVHTLGYGANHNADLLRAISVASRASYTYADADEMIPAVVGSIVGGLQGEVAKDVEVLWEGEATCLEMGAEVDKYWIGTVIAEKEQWVVFEGQPENLRIRWREGEMQAPAAVAGTSVMPHVFRTQAVSLFERIRENSHEIFEADVDDLETRIVRSGMEGDPMVVRILAEIAEMREFLRRPQAIHLTRMISNMQHFTVQRGGDFCSPTQRMVSGQMVHQFSQQDPTMPNSQDPVETE
jgi:hypothetical protein